MANNISFFAKRLCVKQYLNCGIIAAAAPLLAYPSCLGKTFSVTHQSLAIKKPAYLLPICNVV